MSNLKVNYKHAFNEELGILEKDQDEIIETMSIRRLSKVCSSNLNDILKSRVSLRRGSSVKFDT